MPVNYKPRVGLSSVTGSKWKTFVVGRQMIGLILGYRLLAGKVGTARYSGRGTAGKRQW